MTSRWSMLIGWPQQVNKWCSLCQLSEQLTVNLTQFVTFAAVLVCYNFCSWRVFRPNFPALQTDNWALCFKYTRWSHQFSRFLFWKQYSLSTRLIYCCSKSASQVHTVRNYLPILRSNVITSNCVQTSRHWPPNHYVTKSNYAFAIALEALAESWHLHATLPPSLRYAHCNNIELRCVIFQDLHFSRCLFVPNGLQLILNLSSVSRQASHVISYPTPAPDPC